MTDEICGEETSKGTPCQNPTDSCPWDHGNQNDTGREPKMDGRAEELVITAVRAGLKFEHQASHAKVHPDTLRRHLCCINTPREATITEGDPCEFCEAYAHAHGEGALQVLEQCKPEFRASASFGYAKREKKEVDASHDHSGEIDTGADVPAHVSAAIADAAESNLEGDDE